MTDKKRAPRKRTPAVESELRPHKIVGQLVGARFDKNGEIVAEEVMGNVAIFRPNFGKVQKLVDQAVEDARETQKIMRESSLEGE